MERHAVQIGHRIDSFHSMYTFHIDSQQTKTGLQQEDSPDHAILGYFTIKILYAKIIPQIYGM